MRKKGQLSLMKISQWIYVYCAHTGKRMKDIQFSRYAFFIRQGPRFIAKCAVLTGDSQLYFMLLQRVRAHLDITREDGVEFCELMKISFNARSSWRWLVTAAAMFWLWRTSLVPTSALTSSHSRRNVEWETYERVKLNLNCDSTDEKSRCINHHKKI